MRFELGAWNSGGEAPVPLSRWRGSAEELAIAGGALFLEIDGAEWIGGAWSLGDLSLLAQQVDAAAARLEAGELALVRSAEDDGDTVPYLRLRPRDGRIEIRMMFITQQDIATLYPIERSGNPARLYEWVEAAGDRWLERLSPDLQGLAWGPIVVESEVLVPQMRATVELARALGLRVR